MGGIINEPPFLTTFKHPSATMTGTIVSIYEVGCLLGSILCAIFGEGLGRRKSIFVGAVLMLAGAAAQTGVSNVGGMIGARVVSGLGMGFINSTVPVLQAEASPSSTRGVFVCFQLTVLNLGVFLAYWVGYGFVGVDGSKAWRIPVALQMVFILPILVLVFIVPESPRWLASHDKPDESLSVIARLQGKPVTNEDVLAQHDEIQKAVAYEKSIKSGSWSDLIREDDICSRKRLLIACSIQFFQQLGGINALIYYAGNFFALVSSKPALMAGGLFSWFLAASLIPWMLIDTVGRRKLLLVTIAGMAAAFAIEAGCIWKVQMTSSKAAGAAASAFLFVYIGLFTIGFQAVVWVYPSEILPLRLRQKGSAVSTACNWAINYMVVQITPVALDSIGYKFFIIFAIFNLAFLPPIYFFYPETKGMTLEAVDLLFSKTHATSFEEAKAQTEQIEDVDSSKDKDLLDV